MTKRINRAAVVVAISALGAIALPAQTITGLVSFDGTNGMFPYAGLVQGANGKIYGTTLEGGVNGPEAGTVFNITTTGALTTVYNFCPGGNCPTGQLPYAGLVQAVNGYFYGTAAWGGANDYGVVFKMNSSGKETVLYSFCAQSGCPDGANPWYGSLVQATNGSFYGTTRYGGQNGELCDGSIGCGTIFKITPSGNLTTLYRFCSGTGCSDGANPEGGLVQAPNGDFYGTTPGGGANSCYPDGCGTIFKITASGELTTLYSFCSETLCADGSVPTATLVQATNGDFYGTTLSSGNSGGGGTVFKITPNGKLTTLYSFCSITDCGDGNGPNGVIQASDGNFYGTTYQGGNDGGTIFEITPSGALTTIYIFTAGPVGYNPGAPLVQDTNGDLYGTTINGGTDNLGAVFSLSLGLPPFVKPQPAAGKAGAAIDILGTDLTGAISVTFNGIAADFDVISSSEIKTTVPAGATSGTVQVVTPGGTLSSNVPFRVLP
jgi:uncharacterized repeat protein (TIGR03803 family)